jgi:hypothetical protein
MSPNGVYIRLFENNEVMNLNIEALKQMDFDTIRKLYFVFLKSKNLSSNTIKTACSGAFYLRKKNPDLFWKAVESNDGIARDILLDVLRQKTTGNAEKLVNSYLSHIRLFRLFVTNGNKTTSDYTSESTMPPKHESQRKTSENSVPTPSSKQVKIYLDRWKNLDRYPDQEKALNKLFTQLCPHNKDIKDILLKVATLNTFYSTSIFSVYPVAKHIRSLKNIDERLKKGDETLVNNIKQITINEKQITFYSFASKYCSHHNPQDYPIYDSYVDKVLRYFRKKDKFSKFKNDDLKDYVSFKVILKDFITYYELSDYEPKQVDRYLWQLGKEYFPN